MEKIKTVKTKSYSSRLVCLSFKYMLKNAFLKKTVLYKLNTNLLTHNSRNVNSKSKKITPKKNINLFYQHPVSSTVLSTLRHLIFVE